MSDPEDPPRLVDPGSAASPRLRRLIEGSRADVGTTAEIQKLEAALAPALWPGSAGSAAAKAASAKGAATTAIKVAAGALVVAGAGALWLSTSREPRPAAPVSVSEARPAVPAPALLPARAEPPSAPQAEAPATADVPRAPELSPSGSTSPRRSPVSTLSEADLLGQAQSALAGDPARALALAEQHRSHFAHGVLVQEREVIAVEALARLGRAAEAKARGERFLRVFPSSAHRSKIQSIVVAR